jgi:CheY-like chemotaxis protein
MPDVDGFTLAREVARDDQLNALKVILLTSAGSNAPDVPADRFSARLTKPVKQSDLLDAIVTAFAGPVPAPHRSSRPAPDHRLESVTTRALRILVAEDNLTNQKLVDALLTQRGHRVTLVANGRQAIASAAAEPFDVILMDVQMPEVGGLEATASIRERERTTGRRTPIVALTASAMAGDREQCLEAGMDGYVAKPLRADELFAAIDAVTGLGTATVDLATLLAGFNGNAHLVQEVADVFVQDAPAMLARLRDAARARQTEALAAAAHAIKGATGLFSQGPAYQSARRLEAQAKAGDLTTMDAACADIEADVARLVAELRDLPRGWV